MNALAGGPTPTLRLGLAVALAAALTGAASCAAPAPGPDGVDATAADRPAGAVAWADLDGLDVDALNATLVPGRLTADVGIYMPSNLDPAYTLVTTERMLESFLEARRIFEPTGVQLRLLWFRTGEVDPGHLAIQSNEIPGVPNGGYVNMYEHSRRHPSIATPHALEALGSMVKPHPEAHRTVHLVVMQDVFYPFLEVAEGRNWMIKSVRTGGLSFPTYSYVNTLPAHLRGVITITNLARPDRFRRTVAHEIGHKLINVSHEYRETDPGHEVYADGGLMLYGDGEEIPSGPEGRFHLERLHLSPFLYVLEADGSRTWNPEYVEGGHYYDPIYGDFVVRFEGTPPIAEGW